MEFLTAKIGLKLDDKQAKSALKNTERNFKKSIDRMKKAAKGLTTAFKKMFTKLASIAKKGAKILVISFLAISAAAVKFASDAEEIRSKFNTVFKELSKTAKDWAKDFGNSVGRASQDVEKWMSGLQDTFVPLGFARDKSFELSKSLTKLAVDVASFNNQLDADVIRDFTSAMVGNHETVRKFGILISENSITQEAMNQGMNKTYKQLTDLEKVQLRYNLIMKGSKDAMNDAVRTGGSLANQWKRMKANFKELLEAIGVGIMPVVTAAFVTINKFLENNIDKLIEIGKKIGAEMTAIFEGVKTPKEFFERLKTAFIDIVVPFVKELGVKLEPVMKTAGELMAKAFGATFKAGKEAGKGFIKEHPIISGLGITASIGLILNQFSSFFKFLSTAGGMFGKIIKVLAGPAFLKEALTGVGVKTTVFVSLKALVSQIFLAIGAAVAGWFAGRAIDKFILNNIRKETATGLKAFKGEKEWAERWAEVMRAEGGIAKVKTFFGKGEKAPSPYEKPSFSPEQQQLKMLSGIGTSIKKARSEIDSLYEKFGKDKIEAVGKVLESLAVGWKESWIKNTDAIKEKYYEVKQAAIEAAKVASADRLKELPILAKLYEDLEDKGKGWVEVQKEIIKNRAKELKDLTKDTALIKRWEEARIKIVENAEALELKEKADEKAKEADELAAEAADKYSNKLQALSTIYENLNNKTSPEYIKTQKEIIRLQAEGFKGLGINGQIIKDWSENQLKAALEVETGITSLQDRVIEFANSGESHMSSFFQSMIDGSKNASEGFKDFGKSIISTFQKMLADMMAEYMKAKILQPLLQWGISSLAPSIGGMVGGVFGATAPVAPAYSMSMAKPTAPVGFTPRPFADGGITSGISMVGEAGPEAVVPLPGNRKIPVELKEGAGQANVTVNVINETSKDFAAEEEAPYFDGTELVQNIILTDLNTNGPIRNAITGI